MEFTFQDKVYLIWKESDYFMVLNVETKKLSRFTKEKHRMYGDFPASSIPDFSHIEIQFLKNQLHAPVYDLQIIDDEGTICTVFKTENYKCVLKEDTLHYCHRVFYSVCGLITEISPSMIPSHFVNTKTTI